MKDILVVYYALMFGMIQLPALAGIIPTVKRAKISGYKVYEVIDRDPLIRSPKDPNKIVTEININQGITFEHVKFRYPTAPDGSRDVLSDANFTIKSGTSTAIVGPSGSGKSTIV